MTAFFSFDFLPVIENFGGTTGDDKGNRRLESFLNGAVLTNTLFNGGSQINSVPNYAEAFFNGRTVPEFDNEQMKDIFYQVLEEYEGPEADLDLEIQLDLAPVITNPNNKLVELA